MNPLFSSVRVLFLSLNLRGNLLWVIHMGHPNIEVFLSQLEKEIFTLSQKPLRYSNLSQAEWQIVRSLANDRNTVIKKADKGSCVVIWDRLYYTMEAEKQLSDKTIYKDVTFSKNIIPNLTEKSNKIFENLKHKGFISEKQLKHFRFHFKNSCNLAKLYFLSKIHKRLSNVPRGPVISNCGTPSEKVSEFLDNHLKPIMKKSFSYIKDSGDFINKIRRMGSIPDNAVLVTADITTLYTSSLTMLD